MAKDLSEIFLGRERGHRSKIQFVMALIGRKSVTIGMTGRYHPVQLCLVAAPCFRESEGLDKKITNFY